MERKAAIMFYVEAFVLLFLRLTTKAEQFHGRHVCNLNHTVTHPVPVQQSYVRAVRRKDSPSVVYQTAFRTVFRMQIRSEPMIGCCPGWEKRSPRDTGCLKPICEESCENGGECMGPGLCVCSEGYTGYKCHIDIDECSGRNACQQKCTNLPGSYECSCQEGFKLAKDEYTCDLCLSCTEEFRRMEAQMKMFQSMNKDEDSLSEIRRQIDNLTDVTSHIEMIPIILSQLNDLSDSTVQTDRFKQLQNEVDTLIGMIKEEDTIKDLKMRIDILQNSSMNTNKFKEIQNQIDELKEVKVLGESIYILNDTIQSLQKDDSQTRKLEEIQEQIDDLMVIKAQQDRAQVDRFEEISKELEVLRDYRALSQTVRELAGQVEQMSQRIHELEMDKTILRDNLTAAMSNYESAMSALHAKEMTREPEVTTDLYELDPMPLDRLASLSEQISILEEKMADCACSQDYSRG